VNEIIHKWYSNPAKALEEAKVKRKPVMLQFERDNCSGCRKLYSVTFKELEVEKEIFKYVIPLRVNILKEREIRRKYSAVWTPSFYFINYKGKLFYSFSGYLPPEDFRIILRLGVSSFLVPQGKYSEAIEILEEGIRLFPENPRRPELMLKLGMAKYLKTWDNKMFRREMDEIRRRFPDSAIARMWAWEDENYTP